MKCYQVVSVDMIKVIKPTRNEINFFGLGVAFGVAIAGLIIAYL